MADARIGIATIASWRRPPVRFLHRHFGATLFASWLLVAVPFFMQSWSVLALSTLAAALFLANARTYKRTLEWRSLPFDSYRLYNEAVPQRVEEIAQKIRTVQPEARIEVMYLAQDPVLLLRGVNEVRYLAGWDGAVDLF